MAKSSPEEMALTMINNLKEKTGKTIDQWVKVIKKESFAKHGEIVKFLKSEHEVTHGFANLIAQVALKGKQVYQVTQSSADELLATQYSGGKEELKPIYDAIIAAVSKFGSDIEVSPKKAYVSLRRSKQFAIVQPSTKTRVDIGINLKGVEPDGRLEKAGSFNSMVSHRVKISAKKEVDAELKKWLKQAYENA